MGQTYNAIHGLYVLEQNTRRQGRARHRQARSEALLAEKEGLAQPEADVTGIS